MFGNQIHPLHTGIDPKDGYLTEAPRGAGGQNISVGIATVAKPDEPGDRPGSLSRVWRLGPPRRGESTFNGNENSLNYATPKFMSNTRVTRGAGVISFHGALWRHGRVDRDLLFTRSSCNAGSVGAQRGLAFLSVSRMLD